jgi:hypothetical protein
MLTETQKLKLNNKNAKKTLEDHEKRNIKNILTYYYYYYYYCMLKLKLLRTIWDISQMPNCFTVA